MAAYVRVSTDLQDGEIQRQAITRYLTVKPTAGHVLGEIVWYEDQASGATRDRPNLNRLMADVRRGAIAQVVVYKFDRFARSTRHLLDALEEFESRGVAFTSLTEGIDTTTSMGRMVFTFLAAIAEFERELIRERVKAGMAVARKRGKLIGRKRVPVDVDYAHLLLAEGHSIVSAARLMRVKRSTLSRYLRDGSNHAQKAP